MELNLPCLVRFKLFNPKSDQHVISPHSNTAESNMVVMRKSKLVVN